MMMSLVVLLWCAVVACSTLSNHLLCLVYYFNHIFDVDVFDFFII